MSITFEKESENLFVICVKGILTFNDQKEVENRVSIQIDRSRKVKLLVLTENFSGWDKAGDWGDLTFMHEYDPYIEKIAVVADEKWQDQIFMFVGAGMRAAQVMFFPTGEEEKARDWLQSENE